MQKIISIRWKILAGLLAMAVIPMLLLTYLFSDLANGQIREQLDLLADQSGRYVMESASQEEDMLQEALELMVSNEELLNAIYFGQVTGDPAQLHSVLMNYRTQFGFDQIEMIYSDGLRHVLTGDSKTAEPVIIPASEAEKVTFKSTSSSQIVVEKDRLSITSTAPLLLNGELLGHLRASHYIDNQQAAQQQSMIDADIAFHDGVQIIVSSNAAL